MSTITGLKKGKTRAKRIDVFVDEKFAISLAPETALKEKVSVGQELGKAALEALGEKDRRQRCFNSAVRFIGYRPRSEAEIKQRLAKHGFENDIIEKTLARLKDKGFVDDNAFAHYWVENRDLLRPRGKRLTKMELKRKGLGTDIIEKAVSAIDEQDSAYRAAVSRARRLDGLDYNTFRLRLGQYLGRRGFNYGIIKEITEKVWKELRKK
jgi:regulatory protein